MKVVIVGGVAGGASAATRLRRLDESADITIFERTGHISYANCGLPYYIGSVITDKKALSVQTPETFGARFDVEVRVHHEVLSIDRGAKTVRVKDLISGDEWDEPYDKLILSPGARPIKPPLPGIDSDKIFTLRTVEDTYRIHDYVASAKPKSAIIVGGGFIGVEVAENLRGLGMSVTIIDKLEQLMGNLDSDMASIVHANMRDHGVKLRLGSSVAGFKSSDDEIAVMIDGSFGVTGVTADMVVLAIGVVPDSSLASSAGLALGVRGTIAVDEHMMTSDPDIYAVGDAVQVKHFIIGEDTAIALAGPANKQGRIAADNICGVESRYLGSMGTSVIKVFDMTAASTGLTERAARAACIDCDCVILSPASHATYYPGASLITMKVVYEKNTLRLLGAQIVGTDGVDKRIDVIATAIHAGMRADRLKDLELAYAPPYSSAKDPVNMAGYIIENVSKDLVKQYRFDEVSDIDLPRNAGVSLVDVRSADDYAKGHVSGSVNIPLDALRGRLGEIDKSKPVCVICKTGLNSYIACRILSQNGYRCYNFSGGYLFYSSVMCDERATDNRCPCSDQ